MNKYTYLSLGLIISFFLPWFDFIIFTVSGFEIPTSIDKLKNVSGLFRKNEYNNFINISYVLYLIPLLSTTNIASDFNGKKRNLLLNEFTIGLVCILYVIYLSIKLNLPSGPAVGITSTLWILIISIVLIIRDAIIENWNKKNELKFNEMLIQQNQDISQNDVEKNTPSSPDIKSHQEKIDSLQKLKQLLDAGILTQEEFEQQKKQILT